MWSVAVHCVPRLCSFPGGVGQGQPPPVFYPGLLCMSCKAIGSDCYLCWTQRFPGEAKLWV